MVYKFTPEEMLAHIREQHKKAAEERFGGLTYKEPATSCKYMGDGCPNCIAQQ
jgi:hypothetical protein